MKKCLLSAAPGLSVLCAIVLLAAAAMPALAGGSTYSRFGVGDLVRPSFVRSLGMASTGTGLTGGGFINRLNPAGLSYIDQTRFEGSFQYSMTASSDYTGSSNFQRGDFESVAFAFPVYESRGIGLLIDAAPYSRVNYSILSLDGFDTTSFEQKHIGSGGLFQIGIGTSYMLNERVRFGLKFNYIFGSTDQTLRTTVADDTYQGSDFEQSTHHHGSSFSFGVLLDSVGTLIGWQPLQALNVGLVVSTQASMTSESRRYGTSSVTTDTISLVSGTSTLPWGFDLGVSHPLGADWVGCADVSYQNWGAATLMNARPAEYQDSYRFSIGAETRKRREGPGAAERTNYSVGLFYNSSYLKIQNTSIRELGAAVGLGFPISMEASMRLSLQYSVRGTTDGLLQRDTMLRLNFSISASEIWFMELLEE